MTSFNNQNLFTIFIKKKKLSETFKKPQALKIGTKAFLRHSSCVQTIYQKNSTQSNHQGFLLRGGLERYVGYAKQSPYVWFGKFNEAVVKFGMCHCQPDHSIFNYTSDREEILLII